MKIKKKLFLEFEPHERYGEKYSEKISSEFSDNFLSI